MRSGREEIFLFADRFGAHTSEKGSRLRSSSGPAIRGVSSIFNFLDHRVYPVHSGRPTRPPSRPPAVRCMLDYLLILPQKNKTKRNPTQKSPLRGFCRHGPRGGVLELVHDARPREAGRSRGHRAALSRGRPQRPGDNHLSRQDRALLGQRHVSLHPGVYLTRICIIFQVVGARLKFHSPRQLLIGGHPFTEHFPHLNKN